MKKTLLSICATALVLSFTACGGGKKEGDTPTTPEAEVKKETPHTNQKVESTSTGKLTDFESTADVKLNNITLDFWPAKSEVLSDPRTDGKQIVRVEFTITSTSTKPYTYNYSLYTVQTPKTPKTTVGYTIGAENVTDFEKKTTTIEKGKPFTSALYFDVDSGAKAEDITFMIEGYDKDGKTISTELKVK